MCMCLLLKQQYLVFVRTVADQPGRPTHPPTRSLPRQIPVFVRFLPSLGDPFVHTSSQVVSLSGRNRSSHTLGAQASGQQVLFQTTVQLSPLVFNFLAAPTHQEQSVITCCVHSPKTVLNFRISTGTFPSGFIFSRRLLHPLLCTCIVCVFFVT